MNLIKSREIFLFKASFFLALFAALPFSSALANTVDNSGNVNVVSEQSDNRIAPGEFLPVSVKLVNFGSQKKIDVAVDYEIFNNANKEVNLQNEIYSETETVAVETTASFVKRIQLPYTIKPGFYNLVVIVHYPDQQQPAVSKVPFKVEDKIGGFFESDLIIYFAFAILIVLVVILTAYILSKRRQKSHISLYDYSNKPKGDRIYYEILGDIIAQMRLRIGDRAIDILKEIPELEINESDGYVVNIKQDPAKVTARLISLYEELIGQPISFNTGKR